MHTPCITVLRRCDGSSTKNGLILHEILLATGEDGAVVDKKVSGYLRIGYHNNELITHPNRE
jgi:hypothetical protein